MRRILALTGVLLCLLTGSAAAQSAYRLQPGDVLQVWIAQERDADSVMAIGPDGWTSFPLAGHLRGEGLTVGELEAALLDKIKPFFKEKPNLTLMLQPREQHLPRIYVTGDVVTPGDYPYRPEMTVLHGISLAGGLFRTVMLPADQDRSVLVKREIEASEVRLKQLSLLALRLKAELSGQATIANSGLPSSDPALIEEQRLLDENLDAAKRQIEAQEQAKAFRARNIKALSEQIDTLATRLRLAQNQLGRITNLVSKGAAGAAMQNEQEAVIAALEGDNSELKSSMVDAERAKITEDAEFESTRHARKTRLLLEIQTAERELASGQAALEDSRRIMRIYRDAAAENQQLGDRTIRYRILRIIDGKPTELEVTETSMMSPSDLLRVTYEDARTSRATATELPGQAPDAAKDATSDVSGDASGQKTTVTGATQ
jgi:exopolysaccharide production protein ExoF